MAWEIRYGLSGGFGGVEHNDWEPSDAATREEAENEAYELACAEYESYEGLHGLRTMDDIMEEDDIDEAEAEEIYRDERDGWVDYQVREVKESRDGEE